MNLNLIMRQYDTATNPSGGAMPPSLADLSDPNYVPPATTVEPDAGVQAAADTQAAADKLAADTLAATEGLNPDGTVKEGYTKDAEGKVTKNVELEPEITPEEEDEAFWKDVDKMHGTELKVEYPEGVTPFSPEGIYHRDKVIESRAIENFDNYLRSKDPRSYAYMLHRQAGGDDESFYSTKSYSLPEYETFKDDTDLQVKLYRSSLLSKGLDADLAQAAVDKAVKNGDLFTKADAAYKAEQKEHEQSLKAIEDAQAQAEKVYERNVNLLNQSLTTAVNEGKGMRFIIPDTDKNNFLQFMKQHVEHDNGTFVLVQRIDRELTPQQMESMYLLYKKGDLSGLIKAKAQTENVNRFRRSVDKSKDAKTSGTDPKPAADFIPLGSL